MYSWMEGSDDVALAGIDLQHSSNFSFASDFYCEPNDVTRGVTLSSDFYCEADDVTRGVTLDACALSFHHTVDHNYDVQSILYDGRADLKAKDFLLDSGRLQQNPAKALGSSISRPAFFEGDEAPSPPEDEFYKFELTTMTGNGMSAAQFANEIIEFLDKEVESSCVTKVSRKKLTIKADVCLEASHCEIKVRIYRHVLGGYSIEMQRKCGDAIAFKTMLEDIISDLPGESGDSSGVCLEPLLSLAESNDPRLQAEAMLALAHAAQNAEIAAQLCTPQVFLLFQKMSEAVCFNILEPLSRLVCLLSALPQAESLPEMQRLQESIQLVGFDQDSCPRVVY
eukprot:CAMPEP_0169208676 /NCGR_PEP_ID=MMETSP1016-20121227/14258_1 /TAXON_ID=342587 /ORGANISM="Karlodinium micrum, Strain CCMP2283" /LENGTH=338 /DNA_ID=CAMNT_0009286065 /DNA_START=59 /DNA_END=1075 /DNA_ORIENTATION=-